MKLEYFKLDIPSFYAILLFILSGISLKTEYPNGDYLLLAIIFGWCAHLVIFFMVYKKLTEHRSDYQDRVVRAQFDLIHAMAIEDINEIKKCEFALIKAVRS